MASSTDSRRETRLWAVVHDVLQRRHLGEHLPDSQVIALYPDLMPALGNHLKRASAVVNAKQDGTQSPEASLLAVTNSKLRREALLPRDFGPYRLLDLVSHGPMGTVYRAVQLGNNREVAVKMIRNQSLLGAEPIDRFRNEINAASQLEHAHIVTVFDVGVEEGHLYYSMQYIHGPSLSELISEAPLSGLVTAEMLSMVARAVDYAHRSGVLHRDIKSSNILIDESTAKPYVGDFGLAKQIDSDSSLTQSGQIIGTASYMSPEQASGHHKSVDVRSDVYSLGAVCYEMLTRRPPFSSESVPATLVQVLSAEPIPPRKLNPDISPDLETICLKCLHKNPARRYQSAAELADDLDRVTAKRPINARRISVFERVARWAKRESKLALAMALIGCLTICLISLLAWLAIVLSRGVTSERELRHGAEALSRSAMEHKYQAEKNFYLTRVNRAMQEWEVNNMKYVLETLHRFQDLDAERDFRSFEWQYLLKLATANERMKKVVGEKLSSVAWSHHGKWIAVGGESGGLYVYDAKSLDRKYFFEAHAGEIPTIRFSSQDKYLLSAGADGFVRVRDPESGNLVQSLRPDDVDADLQWVNDVVVFHDELVAISAGRDGILRKWNLASGELLAAEPAHQNHINHLALSPQENLILTTSRDETVGAFDSQTLQLVNRTTPCGDATTAVCFSPDQTSIFVGNTNGEVKELDPHNLQLVELLYSHAGTVSALVSRSNYLASTSQSGDICLMSPASNSLVPHALRFPSIRRGHTDYVTGLTASPDGRLASVSHDTTLRVWDPLRTADETDAHISGHEDTTWDVEFSPNGKYFASCGSDGLIRLFDAHNLDQPRWEASLDDEVNGLTFSSDSCLMATACDDNSVSVWDVATGNRVHHLVDHQDNVKDVVFIGSTTDLVSSSRDGYIRVWSALTGTLRDKFIAGTPGELLSCDVSANGKLLATGERGYVQIWDLARREILHTGKMHTDQVLCLNFSPDGTLLASGARDGLTILWKVAGCAPQKTLEVNIGTVRCVRFSPDGKCLATGGTDGTVKLWDPEFGELRAVYHGHAAEVYALAFAPDGMTLASSACDKRHEILVRTAK